jgi:hypothetical protein
MKLEKQRLIHELLDDETRRSRPLLAGVRALRRRRFWRSARRNAAWALVLAAAGLWLEQSRPRHPQQQASAPRATPSAQARPQSLTDDQLLALFPGTPVALATLSDGSKRLIFPRPEDEQRLVRYP